MPDQLDRGMDADEREYRKRAAEVIARGARDNASAFSRRIPAATHVHTSARGAVLVITEGAKAPNAAPFEYAEYHPLFGNHHHDYKQPHRPYMSAAAHEKLSEATDVYAGVIDAWAKRLGYR